MILKKLEHFLIFEVQNEAIRHKWLKLNKSK